MDRKTIAGGANQLCGIRAASEFPALHNWFAGIAIGKRGRRAYSLSKIRQNRQAHKHSEFAAQSATSWSETCRED
jgi:hypothetical protein